MDLQQIEKLVQIMKFFHAGVSIQEAIQRSK